MSEKTFAWSPYRYAFDNPLRFIDYEGLTEEERVKAISVARSLLGKKYASVPKNTKVKSGQLDCSGYVRYSIMQNENINDPFEGRESNGVSRIVAGSRKVTLNKIREGDLVVIKSGGRENGHVGFVSNIVRDENGNVSQYTMLHSEASWTNESLGISGGGDINEDIISVNSGRGYARSKYKHRFYQWDNEENDEVDDATPVTETSSENGYGNTINQDNPTNNTDNSWTLWKEFINALLE